MNIAVPMMGIRVAPRLCFAQDILLVRAADGAASELKQVHVGPLSDPWAFIEWVERQQVEVVLCCGVNRQACATLDARGITVIWGLTGEAELVVSEYLEGQLSGTRVPGKPGVHCGRGQIKH